MTCPTWPHPPAHLCEFLMHSLPSPYHYIRIAISPARDALGLRKTLQDALTQTFGITSAGLYIDVLWLAADAGEAVIRINKE
ncbi:hypothetical protein C0993_008564 [Termitomyces sp. T159_Od127]|nr:hypothetical protein C0993_008564 [Termitomyces sp. T159_Od127]